ncbi:MAG: flavodoxin family protein [Firmicutes bacterium]|nr:flavodoxin family protein [Bacillota bacterium]
MLKILGICGSPKKGATEYFLKESLKPFEDREDVQVDYIFLKGKKISACTGCDYCRKNQKSCIIKDDMEELLNQFLSADAFVIASPVYAYGATPQIHAFFSRMRPIFHLAPTTLRDKFGVAMAVGGRRNGGQETVVSSIHNLMMSRGINIISNECGGYAGAYLWSKDQKEIGAAEDEYALDQGKQLVNKLVEMMLRFKKD